MWLLRISIFCVVAFRFTWSLCFPPNKYIFMCFRIIGAIYMGGANTAIIGGLYWKRGTVGSAREAMIIGYVFTVSGIQLRNIIWP